MNFLSFLFDTAQYPARWECGNWLPIIGWTHIVSDLFIFLAYVGIPASLLYYQHKIKTRVIKLDYIFYLFAGFIFFCGSTHLIEAIIFWEPIYNFQALVKLATAVISVMTLLIIFLKLPQTLKFIIEKNDAKELKLQLLQQSKLASLGQLAAGVAHEINNPISFVMGNMGVLNRYLDNLKDHMNEIDTIVKSIPSDQEGDFHKVVRELQTLNGDKKVQFVIKDTHLLISESISGLKRIAEIVANLKTFTHTNDSNMQYADINECLESALKIISNELKYKCTIIKECHDLPLLACYPNQLNQVFVNLLMNACQSMREQGVIILRTEVINNEIVVSITDSGEGIKPENLSRLFEPFFTTKPVGKGTGLGLSISYNIIQKHGGRIDVDSIVGEGTKFTITLPINGLEMVNREAAVNA